MLKVIDFTEICTMLDLKTKSFSVTVCVCVHMCILNVSVGCCVTVTVYLSLFTYMLPEKLLRGYVALGALKHSQAELLLGCHSKTYVYAQKDAVSLTHTHTYTEVINSKLLQFPLDRVSSTP